jgi:hypothetical protein
MTDKELAEEYYYKTYEEYYYKTYYVSLNIGEEERKKEVIDIFLAGLKAGRLQWHDLRKDPNDLPNGYKVVLNQVGMDTQYDPNRGFLGFGGIGIIAWCEIPSFDKE